MAEENDASDPFVEARRLNENHEYAAASDAYKGALKAFEPAGKQANDLDAKVRRREGYKGLADSLFCSGRYEEIKSINIAPEQPEGYTGLGEAFDGQRRYREATEYYDKAAKIYDEQVSTTQKEDKSLHGEELAARRQAAKQELEEANGNYVDLRNDIGSNYQSLGQYDKAIEQFTIAIERGKEYPYAHHNLASVYRTQGRYKEAMEESRKARTLYQNLSDVAAKEEWVGHFLNFGNLLHEVFGELANAKTAYEAGLEIDRDHKGILISQLALYSEMMDGDVNERNTNSLAARDAYKKAKGLLDAIPPKNRDFETLITMGELALTKDDFKEAELRLNEALSKNEVFDADVRKSARPATDLGILCVRRREFKQAIQYFKTAVEMAEDDLSITSNLAEAYLNDGQLEEAEKHFQRVLQMSPDHVESRIGLARVYADLGATGDPDMYDAAVAQYNEAITLAERNTGSKRLKKKERAAVFYSRAYARVKLYEESKGKDLSLLYDARGDFKDSLALDPEQFKAKRAVEKIDKVLPRRSPQGLLEKWGPLVILACSTIVFLLSQIRFVFWFNGFQHLTVNDYVVPTFGSLVLMIASCYLPQMLKLKIPGIELEKSVMDQITFVGTVGIRKQ